jgi:hypothetical protein
MIGAIFADGPFAANSANLMGDLNFKFSSQNGPLWVIRHGRHGGYIEELCQTHIRSKRYARRFPKKGEPIGRDGMLAAFDGFGERRAIPWEFKPDSFIAVS